MQLDNLPCENQVILVHWLSDSKIWRIHCFHVQPISLILFPDFHPKRIQWGSPFFTPHEIRLYVILCYLWRYFIILSSQSRSSYVPLSFPLNPPALHVPQSICLVLVNDGGCRRRETGDFCLVVSLLNSHYFGRSTHLEVGSILSVGRDILLIPFFDQA